MKFGESTFDIIYLVFAITMGCLILKKRKDDIGKLMGYAVLVLGCGDAFHLIPRVLNYFVNFDFTALLGFGKLVTSITMTVFYVLMYELWLKLYSYDKKLRPLVYALCAVRIVLCLFPQNNWFSNESSVLWGVLRNIPFIILGVLIIVLYYKKKDSIANFRNVWLLVALSFLFYIPVAFFASVVPMLGMLMLPKTVCYMILIWTFWKQAF